MLEFPQDRYSSLSNQQSRAQKAFLEIENTDLDVSQDLPLAQNNKKTRD